MATKKKKAARLRAAQKPAPRKRRTADEARAAILDAAERRLIASGPAGIRLQEVAQDVGVSHPTVLHHFGSREALVQEVCERRVAQLQGELAMAIGGSSGGADQICALLERVSAVVRENGHARVFFWLALEGLLRESPPGAPRLRLLGEAAQQLRTRRRGGKAAPLEDTLHVLALSSLALFADAIVGPIVLADLGLGEAPEASARFRSWLADLLADHLQRGV